MVTGSSDGAVRIWLLTRKELAAKKQDSDSEKQKKEQDTANPQQVGKLVGTYETGNRITCLKAFVMLPPEADDPSALGESEFESFGDDDEEEEKSSSSDDEDDE